MTSLREKVFWARDAVTGGAVRAELTKVEAANSSHGDPRPSALREQLAHVARYVPYYRDLAGVTELTHFPVVNKALVREHADQFVATGADTSRMHVASTSGSTGTPFRVFHDARKRLRVDAEAIYFGRHAGYEIGQRLFYVKVWSDRNRRSRLGFFMRNIVPVDVIDLHRNSAANFMRQLQGASSRSAIIAYSSSLDMLAKALPSSWNPVKGTLGAVIAQSETLVESTRQILADRMGVHAVARYGMEELGIVAQQERDRGSAYTLNRASHVVEILKEYEDVPAAPGELGRIVVTELVNRVQPLVRYDTGDLGSFAGSDVDVFSQTVLTRIEGRRTDRIYDVEDRPLPSLVAYAFWWKYPQIAQYQIVQRARGDYLLRLHTSRDFSDERSIVTDLRGVVGATARIDVEYANDGFVLSSGKRKSVVSYYTPHYNG